MAPSDLDLEGRLRDLRRRADSVANPPPDLAETVRARDVRQRRAQLRLAAAGLAAATLFIGIPVVASSLESQRSQTADPSESAPAAEQVLFEEPTRGSLADDEEWLAGIAVQPVPLDRLDPAPEDPTIDGRHTAFGGDVPGGRVALELIRLAGGTYVQAWFTGPPGAEAAEMSLVDLAPARPTDPLALVDMPDPASGQAVLTVVAFPGDEVEVLTGHTVTPSGEVRERWEEFAVEEGAGSAVIDSPVLWLRERLQLRISNGEGQDSLTPRLTDRTDAAEELPAVELADPRGMRVAVDESVLRTAIRHLVAGYGLRPEEMGLTLLVGGPVEGLAAHALLVGATFPSGATVGFLAVYPDDAGAGQTFESLTATGVAPAGTTLLDRVFAVELSDIVTISGPTAGARADVYDAEGALLASVPLVQGAGAGAVPSQTPAEVRILDAAGGVLISARVTQPGE
jgi:hypothetical protein